MFKSENNKNLDVIGLSTVVLGSISIVCFVTFIKFSVDYFGTSNHFTGIIFILSIFFSIIGLVCGMQSIINPYASNSRLLGMIGMILSILPWVYVVWVRFI